MHHKIAEYSLADLVEDPMIGLVMMSDGVDRRSIELLFDRVARERPHGVHTLPPRLYDTDAPRCPRC